jgi:hypothetical protein
LTCTLLTSYAVSANTLIEVDGFMTLADSRLAQLRERLGGDLHRLLTIGSYAVPLPEAAGSAPAHAAAVYGTRG